MKIKLDNLLKGKILDIGGGGEGVIGRIYQQQVIAIDNDQEELDETPNVCKKMLMTLHLYVSESVNLIM